jgi:RHS repeat-associated protein
MFSARHSYDSSAKQISNGIFRLSPDTAIHDIPNGEFFYYDQMYWISPGIDAQNNISFAVRVRAPNFDAGGNRIPNLVSLRYDTYAGGAPDEDFNINLAEDASGNYRLFSTKHDTAVLSNKDLGNWHTIRFEVKDSAFRAYYDDTLLLTVPRNGSDFIQIAEGITIRFKNGAWAEMDWARFDRRDTVFYFDEFDGPSENPFSRPDPAFLRPRQPCHVLWPLYFRGYFGGRTYTYNQISAYYKMRCGYTTTPCPGNGPMLCGKAAPVAMPFKQYNSCDDSTLFATVKGTQLYEYYRDSLQHVFEDRYRAKCLEARFKENFTVEQPVSEYHYTLYYYDQAGNLVKTVPPAGVNTSKFAWSLNWSDSVKTARSSKQVLTPVHALPTNYRYNTLNQVVAQHSPDGKLSEFWYDRLGRLAISRNAKQYWAGSSDDNNRLYSYTKYDVLGRITEVGQVKNLNTNGTITDNITRNETLLNNWLLALDNRREQVTSTVYDIPYDGYIGFVGDTRLIIRQRNLRNRVSYVTYADAGGSNFNQGTFYTYDIHGNVDTLLQDYGPSTALPNIMNKNGNRYKKITYKYDLISGKVNMVMYQRGWSDQFFHRYSYDAENRLTLAETSTDSLIWEKDARYEYYRHGPLARTTIGEQSVQGLDYAYTLQGWLKGINSTGATSAHDMGGDAKTGHLNQYTAQDAIGVTLNYFTGEYKPISSSVAPFPGYSGTFPNASEYRPLYNGNISSMSTYLRPFENNANDTTLGPIYLYNYRYDQLNRLTAMDAYRGFNTGTNSWSLYPVHAGKFRERVSYDANGNILTYNRNGTNWQPEMDNLAYGYYAGTNRLKHITETMTDIDRYGGQYDPVKDIDPQADSDNYKYDSIGNLIKDSAENIRSIEWTVYGKIKTIIRNPTDQNNVTKISYSYDAQGNRTGQVVEKSTPDGVTRGYTWYVRDGQGNVMGVYRTPSDTITNLSNYPLVLAERHIYGSSRLGVTSSPTEVDNGNAGPSTMAFYNAQVFYRGYREYELSNHLGNVLTVVSDKKIGVYSGGIGSLIDYYKPHILSAQDYYPFGMVSRAALNPTNQHYRYGFNGKENDNDVKGYGNQQDYGMRIYDGRLGRFLSVDPIAKDYPELTPYQFASNRPIDGIDQDGLEYAKPMTQFQYDGSWGIFDRLKAIPNAVGRTWNGLVVGTYNSGVSTYKSVERGTYISDVSGEARSMATGIKNYAVEGYNYHANTPLKQQVKDFGNYLANPQTTEDAIVIGFALYSLKGPGGGKGNLLKPETKAGTTAKTVAKTETKTAAKAETSSALTNFYPPNGGAMAGTTTSEFLMP